MVKKKRQSNIINKIYMKKILLFAIVIILFAACTPKSNISGSMTDAEGKTIYLEHTGLTATTVLDSK